MIVQQSVHYFLHFIFPLIVALVFFQKQWKRTYIIFVATMLVDLDHLLANPVFDPCRCSIGFHPLHSYVAIGVYVVMSFVPKLRLVGIGLVMHMVADYVDCLFVKLGCA